MANRIEVEIGARDLSGPGFDSATARARTFKGALSDTAAPLSQVEQLGNMAAKGLAGLVTVATIDRWRQWHGEVQKTIGDLAAQADAVGVNTDHLQAYQAAARSAGQDVAGMQAVIAQGNVTIGQAAAGEKSAAEAYKDLKVQILDVNGKTRDNTAINTEAARALLKLEDGNQRAALSKQIFGRAGAQLTPVLRELALGMTALDIAARANGQTVDRETIEIYRRLNDQQDETLIRLRNLYAQAAAPLQFTAVETLNSLLKNVVENAGRASLGVTDLLAIAANPGAAVSRLFSLAGPSQRDRQQSEVDQLNKNIAADMGRLEGLGPNDARRGSLQATIDRRRSELAAKERQLQLDQSADAASRLSGDFTNIDPNSGRRAGAAFAQPKETGSEKRDRIGEEIAKLAAEAQAAEAGLRLLSQARPGTILAELERAAALEKKIGEIIAAAGKYKPSDERIAQLRVEATAAESARQAYERRKQVLELADATEAKYGDGQRQLRDTQLLLTEAVGVGRLSQEAMNAAMLEAGRSAEDQTLKLQGLRGGLEGFSAGIQYAVAQEQRQNTVFNLGVKAWQQGGQIFQSVTNDIANGAEVNFGRVALSFVNMMSQMAFAAAQSQIGNVLFGGKGGGGGLLGEFLGGGASGTAPGVLDSVFTATQGSPFMFAEGGRPPVGVPSIVGDGGEPEWFIPDQPGTIVPFSKMGRAAGGESSVIVHQTMYFGSDVKRAELATWAKQIELQTRAAVIDDRQRGGTMRTVFRR